MLSSRIRKFVLIFPRRRTDLNHSFHISPMRLRCFSAFSGSDTTELHKLLVKKDPQMLIQYIIKDWSTKTKISTGSAPKITSMITSLYITKSRSQDLKDGKKMDFAFGIVEVIFKEDSNNLYLAYLDFLDFCIENKLLDEAMQCVSKIKGLRRVLSSPLADKLTTQLVSECRIDDITTVMDLHDVSEVMLTATAEPLLLSGLHHDYLQYLRKYLKSNTSSNRNINKANNIRKHLPHPLQVESILQAIIVARLRVSLSSTGESELDSHFLSQLTDCLTDYHKEYLQDPNHNNSNEYPDSKSLPTYKLLQRLRYDDGRKQFYDDMRRNVLGIDMTRPPARSSRGRQTSTSSFEFLSEDKIKHDSYQSNRPKRSRRKPLEVRDLTMDISRRQRPDPTGGLFSAVQRPLLYSSTLFPGDLEREMGDVKRVVSKWGTLHVVFGSPQKMESDINSIWRERDDELDMDEDGRYSRDEDDDDDDVDDEEDEGDYSLDDEEDDDDDEYGADDNVDDDDDYDGLDDRSESVDSNASVNGDALSAEDMYYNEMDENAPLRLELRFDDTDRSYEPETLFNELLDTLGHGIHGAEDEDDTNLTMKDITRAVRALRYPRELRFSEDFFAGSSDPDRTGDFRHLDHLLAGSGSGSGMTGGRSGDIDGLGGPGGGMLQTKNIFPDDDIEKGDDDDTGLGSGQGVLEVGAAESGAMAGPAENNDQKEE